MPLVFATRKNWSCLISVGIGVAFACMGLFLFLFRPWASCFDIVGTHIPNVAAKRFAQRVIDATLDENYDWLASISQKDALEILKSEKANMTRHYVIQPWEDEFYRFRTRITFDNGVTLDIETIGKWGECPDFDVTDEKTFRYLKLDAVFVVK